MTTKRKISVRKILQAVFTLVLTGGCIAAILGASKIQQTEKLKGVFVHVKNEDKYQFLDKETLLKSIISKNELVTNKTQLGKINLKAIEKQVYKNAWVADAQVYVDNQRNMHIYATQHKPEARIFFENGPSYYLNKSLQILPVSDKFTYYTTVVTNVPWYNNDSLNQSARAKIIKLVKTVEKDSFWNAQIEQISMTPDMEFEMYPVLGTHKILFGDTSLAKRKLENLFGFYKNILNKIGWDKYQLLDARFDDQIVASPALAWKMPAKGFISNMDWVKTIMGDEPPSEASLKMTEAMAAAYKPAGSNTDEPKPSLSATNNTTTVIPLGNNNTTNTIKTTSTKPTTSPSVTVPKAPSPKTISSTSKPSSVSSTVSKATTVKPKAAATEKHVATTTTKPKTEAKPQDTKPKATTTNKDNQEKLKTTTNEKKQEEKQPKYILN